MELIIEPHPDYPGWQRLRVPTDDRTTVGIRNADSASALPQSPGPTRLASES